MPELPRPPSPHRPSGARRVRPSFESLEDRCVPAVTGNNLVNPAGGAAATALVPNAPTITVNHQPDAKLSVEALQSSSAFDPRVLYVIPATGRYFRFQGNGTWAEYNKDKALYRVLTEVKRNDKFIELFTTTPQKTWIILTNTQVFWRTVGDTAWRTGHPGHWKDPTAKAPLLGGGVGADPRVLYGLKDGRYIRNEGGGLWAMFNKAQVLIKFFQEVADTPNYIILYTNKPQPTYVKLTNTRLFFRSPSSNVWHPGEAGGWKDPSVFPPSPT